MSQAYPVAETGTAQDLMSIVVSAYARHLAERRLTLPDKPASRRLWLEPPFVGLGAAVSAVMGVLPADWALALHDRLFAALASPRHYAFDPNSAVLEEGRALVERLAADTGRRPALLALISHPPVLGELMHLNFELVRHATLGLRRLRGSPCRPRLVVAVDSFALDSQSLPAEGVYAGFMGRYHLGLDRLALARVATSRPWLRGTDWARMVRRLLATLAEGGEVGMVLAGGVPSTARALYATKEWLWRWRRGRPADVLARLRADERYRAFESEGRWDRCPSVWRRVEAWGMSAVTGVTENEQRSRPNETGTLNGTTITAFETILSAFQLNAQERERALKELTDELGRETPYRARFFRALAGKVGRRRPIVFLPVVHRLENGPRVELKRCWAWRGAEAGGRVEAEFPVGKVARMSAEDFATDFGRENFA